MWPVLLWLLLLASLWMIWLGNIDWFILLPTLHFASVFTALPHGLSGGRIWKHFSLLCSDVSKTFLQYTHTGSQVHADGHTKANGHTEWSLWLPRYSVDECLRSLKHTHTCRETQTTFFANKLLLDVYFISLLFLQPSFVSLHETRVHRHVFNYYWAERTQMEEVSEGRLWRRSGVGDVGSVF